MRKLQFEDVKYILSKVGEISIFHYLTVDEKWKLLNLCEVFQYDAGEKIITQGETGTYFYAILSGSVNVTINDAKSSKEIFLSSTGAGDFFGESGIFSDIRRTANIIAAETTEILSISRDQFFSYINAFTPAGVKILMLFVNGLLKKLNDSNQELAFARRDVLDQGAIDQFLQNLFNANSQQESYPKTQNPDPGMLGPGENLFYHVCVNCQGNGVVVNHNCPECLGRGIIPTELALQFLDFMNVWNVGQFKRKMDESKSRNFI